MKVSVLILTHNEEANLPACLSALSWCDDILVLDSGSNDRTTEIAESHGARLLSRSFTSFADQRNYGLEYGKFRHDWVLHLDADEIVTPEFIGALERLETEPGISAYRIASKSMLFGRWLRFAGMFPAYQVRLGRRNSLRFKQVGHGQREDLPADQIAVFSEPYLHYSFSHGMRRWLEKHIKYAADEAEFVRLQRSQARTSADPSGTDPTSLRRRAKEWAARVPLFLRPAARFFYIYFLRQGFRDGRSGLAYAVMLSVYEGMVSVFAYESLLGETTGNGGRISGSEARTTDRITCP